MDTEQPTEDTYEDLYPAFYQTGERLVKIVRTEDGGMDVLVYEPETDSFVSDISYLILCYDPDEGAEQLDEDEFESRLTAQSQNESEE